jgi:predicted dienelactone hydrolase
MRALALVATLLFAALAPPAAGQTAPYRAGIALVSVPARVPFDTVVWYPTQAEEQPWSLDKFTVPATRDAAFAPGRFPIVLLSHGGGLTGGSPLILREQSSTLARQGFVVIAPFHGTARLALRPLQVTWALTAVLADARFAPHVDPARLGMVGFSLGTAVTLELAGAVPNAAHLVSYCAAHPEDAMSCDHAPGGGNAPPRPSGPPPTPVPLPLKAIVLLDPFAVLFQHDELTAVTMPVLVFRPEQSQLPGQANAFALVAALPHPPQFQIVPGRHFVFTDVCPEERRATARELCEDPPRVDRAAVHRAVEAEIVTFLRAHL